MNLANISHADDSGTRVDGVVERIDGDLAIVKVVVQSGCGRCHEPGGCGGGLAVAREGCSKHYALPNRIGAKAGDPVVLTVPQGGLLKAAALAYGLPLGVGLLAAMAAGAVAADPLVAPLAALAGVALGFLIVHRLQWQQHSEIIYMALKLPSVGE